MTTKEKDTRKETDEVNVKITSTGLVFLEQLRRAVPNAVIEWYVVPIIAEIRDYLLKEKYISMEEKHGYFYYSITQKGVDYLKKFGGDDLQKLEISTR
jgi:hypothetical protein